MEPYQRQEIDQLLDAVNQRNTDRPSTQGAAARLGHTFAHTHCFIN